MAGSVHMCCAVLLIGSLGVHGLTELYCKDPDTGEFHAVNKTWSSTTVCGNYTCRIRRKVKEDMDTHASDVQIVTALPLEDPILKKNETDNKPTTHSEIRDALKSEKHNRSILDILKSNVVNKTIEQDRFLTESEVKTISELLHMVKKSDLEAVVEVYNLAQDIYKELESAPAENKEELYRQVLLKLKPDRPPKVPFNKPGASYWYDPQLYLEGKADTQLAASEPVSSKPAYPYYTPYYYPTSTFHRQASYVHPTRQMPLARPNVDCYRAQHSSCPYARREDTTLLPYPFTAVNQYNQTSPYRAYWTQQPYKYAPIVREFIEEPRKAVLVHPEIHNDVQDIEQHVDKRDEAKAKLLHKAEKDSDDDRPKSLFNTDDIFPLWLTAPLAKNNEDKLAPWQTAPLSEHVLDEVKANILENTEKLLFPFKKLKLEKVAKVLKLDDLTRLKREVVEIVEPVTIDALDFEVYIEKVTCNMDMEPGVFSVGDLTAAFPQCCPKRINI